MKTMLGVLVIMVFLGEVMLFWWRFHRRQRDKQRAWLSRLDTPSTDVKIYT